MEIYVSLCNVNSFEDVDKCSEKYHENSKLVMFSMKAKGTALENLIKKVNNNALAFIFNVDGNNLDEFDPYHFPVLYSL